MRFQVGIACALLTSMPRDHVQLEKMRQLGMKPEDEYKDRKSVV